MGRKVHPMGFRIGVIRDWQSRWYAEKQYAEFLQEDIKLRQAIRSKYAEAGVSMVEIERQANEVSVTVHTARPGVVIGRGGQRVDEMRLYLESLIGKKIRLNIQEIRQPELDAYLVARAIAEQIERRIAYRRAMKQAIFRTMQAGAKGIRINCAGRLGGAEIARRQMMHQGQVPLQTLRADIDYGFTEAHTTLGRLGIKAWIYKGEVFPELKAAEAEAAPAVAVEAGAEAVPSVAEVESKPAELVGVAEAPSAVAEVQKKPARRTKVEKAPSLVAEVEKKPIRRVKAKEALVAVEVERKPAKKAKAEETPVAEAEKKPIRKPKAEEPVAEAEKKPTKKAKAEETTVAEAEKKPTKKAKAEETTVAEVEKKPTRKAKTEDK